MDMRRIMIIQEDNESEISGAVNGRHEE